MRRCCRWRISLARSLLMLPAVLLRRWAPCNTLQHTAAHCNVCCRWRISMAGSLAMPSAALLRRCAGGDSQKSHCNTATHCNIALQHTGASPGGDSRVTPQHTGEIFVDASCRRMTQMCALQHTATHCNALQHTATQCNTLARFLSMPVVSVLRRCAPCNTIQYRVTHSYALHHAARCISQQRATAYCNILQRPATHALDLGEFNRYFLPPYYLQNSAKQCNNCNTLQHSATAAHRNTLSFVDTFRRHNTQMPPISMSHVTGMNEYCPPYQ